MSPIIVLDKYNKPFLTVGSPGGKAIISYVFKVLIDVFYKRHRNLKSIESPNYIKINEKTYFEDKILKKFSSDNKSIIRKLTSGLAVIKKLKKDLLEQLIQEETGL